MELHLNLLKLQGLLANVIGEQNVAKRIFQILQKFVLRAEKLPH